MLKASLDRTDEALDALFLGSSTGFFARLWQGMILHHLLFYRQSALRSASELAALAGDEAGDRKGGRRAAAPGIGRLGPRDARFHVLKGWTCLEARTGSIRFGAEALKNFHRAAALDPGSAWVHASLGMAEESRRNFHQAIRHLDQAVRLRPDWAWSYIWRGVAHWYFAQTKDSIADFQTAVKIDSRLEVAHALLGRARADERDPRMIEDLDRAIRLAPASGVLRAWRGRAHFMLGRNREALRDLSRAIELSPSYDRGHSWRGVLSIRQKRFAAALRDLARAALLNPYYATTQYHLAQASVNAKDFSRALKAMRAASRIDIQDLWEEHFTDIQDSSPAYGRAVEDMESLLERYPRKSWLWAWLGQTRLLLKAYGGALEALNKALSCNPRNRWAYVWRGETRRRLGLCREALEDFGKALVLDRDCAWAHAGRGYCLLFLGRRAAALDDLSRALRLNPKCARGAAHAWRGETHLRLGRFREASEDFKKALEFYPHWEWVKRWLARAQGRPIPSSAPSRRGMDLDFSDGAVLDSYLRENPYDRRAYVKRGELRLGRGDCAGAIEDATHALETNLDPTDAGAILLRAGARRRNGELSSAMDELARLKTLHHG